MCELRQLAERLEAGRSWMPALRVEWSERRHVRDDDDVPGRSGEHPPLRVDDRAARADQVDRAIGLAVRERGIGGTMQDLDRPGAQGQEAERDPYECSQPPDADEESGAAE